MAKLTKGQAAYLRCMDERGPLKCGWGGYKSTVVILRLEELGYAIVRWLPADCKPRWTATATKKGRRALQAHASEIGETERS